MRLYAGVGAGFGQWVFNFFLKKMNIYTLFHMELKIFSSKNNYKIIDIKITI
jgi:hypothetical protein